MLPVPASVELSKLLLSCLKVLSSEKKGKTVASSAFLRHGQVHLWTPWAFPKAHIRLQEVGRQVG